MKSSDFPYRIVKLATGAHSIHSLAHGETFHPVVGPVAEAEALYIRQPNLLERLEAHQGEFVVWDVGLGAAANPITLLRATRHIQATIRVASFDHTLAPLEFALQHTPYLPYLVGYEDRLRQLLREGRVSFENAPQAVHWEFHLADFPTLLTRPIARVLPKPHLIMFDAFSPARNPAMWTAPLFSGLFALLDPTRACVLPTYSRSTMLRVTLLLAGFYVGLGHATGQKEETTVAANCLPSLQQPLDRAWLQRAFRSSSAEPLWTAVYRQAPLAPASREKLLRHPQFA